MVILHKNADLSELKNKKYQTQKPNPKPNPKTQSIWVLNFFMGFLMGKFHFKT
jgi:hypothetical protein